LNTTNFRGDYRRVSIVENASEDAVFALWDSYEKDFDYNFPPATSAVVVQTGPTLTLTVTLYPNEEAANSTLPQREKSMKTVQHRISDSFLY
jgi:hypothetical protein